MRYSQHSQNHLNNYFQAILGKELPKQYPKPPLVGKQNVGFSLSYTTKTREARNYLK